MNLSVAIITYNEERNIERCLASVQNWADEIVVVDSYSKDKTEAICKRFGVRFIQHPFAGHIQQKNFALQQCTGNWILSIDADEAPTADLARSIQQAITESSFGGYRMNRLTNYCGHWVRHCGWYPHDRLDMNDHSETGYLKGDLLHYSYYTSEDHYRQIEYFGNIAAKALYDQGKRVSSAMIYTKVVVQFIKSFILKSGWRDGVTGWNISKRSAYATWRKYQKLRDLWRNA
jgi:glycosyltransferase involved in cell wall biosynthesis